MTKYTGLRPAAIALGLASGLGLATAAQAISPVQEALQLAVCLNDWNSAIARTSQLERLPGLPIKTQAQLVTLRRQMQIYRQNQTALAPIAACGPVLAGFGLPGYSGRPLDLERALYSVGIGSPSDTPDIDVRQTEALWQAGLGVTAATPLDPLAAARRINTRSGSGISTGAVSRQVDVYAFLGAGGDRAALDLTVIQQRPGLLYTDDRALLFIFDAEGRLLAEARPATAAPEALPLPTTGLYYAAVTTPEHRPVLDDRGVIVGWQGIGTSAITYRLTLSGLTPSPRLGR